MKVKALSLVVYMLIASYSPTAINNKVLSNSLIGNALKFDLTYVLDDLYSAKNFDIQDYAIDLEGVKKHPGIINFTEYCFDKDMKLDNYSLYFYLYNPQLINFNYESSLNKIQFSIGNNSYYKYQIELLSKSDDSRFLKFKVQFSDSELKRIKNELDVNKRIYNVSGIELLRVDKNNANDYFASDSTKQIGGTYTYTGFSKGYGSTESTLNCEVDELETIKLNVKDLWKRYDDPYDNYKKNQINSVYFSIPDYYFVNYGNLKAIDFEYYKFRTAPIFVLRTDTYKLFKDYVGKTWSSDDNPGYTIYGEYVSKTGSVKLSGDIYGENNTCTGFSEAGFPKVNKMVWLFDGGSTGLNNIKSDKLKSYMYSYNKSYTNGKNYKGLSNDLFELDAVSSNYHYVHITDSDTNNLLKSNETFWGKMFGKLDDVSYKSLEEVDYSSIDAENLIIDDSLIDDFKNDCTTNKNNNEKTYILRFDNTPYYTTQVFDKKITDIGVTGIDGYVCQEYVYLDFDIIDLTFAKDGVYKNIPNVSDPIDVVSEIEPDNKGNDIWELILKIIKIILLILSIIGIVWLVFKGINLMASMKILLGGNKAKKKKKRK